MKFAYFNFAMVYNPSKINYFIFKITSSYLRYKLYLLIQMGKIKERVAIIVALLFVYFIHYAMLLYAYSKGKTHHKAIRDVGKYLFLYGVAGIYID